MNHPMPAARPTAPRSMTPRPTLRWPAPRRAAPARHYDLVCVLCGTRQPDDGLTLGCAQVHEPALLRTDYTSARFSPRPDDDGLFRYRDWLPVTPAAAGGTGRSAVYRSTGLARALGLAELWIAFNGYWPERGAGLETATFKEFEAYTVLGRMPPGPAVLTVASSGNTGAAFAWACSQAGRPCVVIVPRAALGRFRFRAELQPWVQLVVIDDGDYPDAIGFAARLAARPGFVLEGGVQNVGRRDGLGTVLLAAVEQMGRLPTHYFQAVGSGTGAIAVHEAAGRLQAAGVMGHGGTAAPGRDRPRLMLCQNAPFTPIHDLWRRGQRAVPPGHGDQFRPAIEEVCANELTNWAPPFSIRGGVYDVLTESGGTVLTAGNRSVQAALALFLDQEGIDIEPAAGVAVACLREAAARGVLDRGSVVLLNITGGGRRRAGLDGGAVAAEPRLRLTRAELDQAETVDRVVQGQVNAPDRDRTDTGTLLGGGLFRWATGALTKR